MISRSRGKGRSERIRINSEEIVGLSGAGGAISEYRGRRPPRRGRSALHMTFVQETKNELARVTPAKSCCQIAEIAGFLRFAGGIGIVGREKYKIVMTTPNLAIVRHYKSLIKTYFDVDASIHMSQGGSFDKRTKYSLTLGPEELSEMILREVGILVARAGKNSFTDGIYDELLRTKCCRKSYLRGAFLGSGTISDPKRGYHYEITTRYEATARDLRRLINTFDDITPKIVTRKNRYGVYIKARDQIADMLAIMGANSQYFEYVDAMMNRDLMTHAHRAESLDNANIDKSLRAAQEQLEWIRRIEAHGGIGSLSAGLQEAALMRLEHPDAGLEELGKLFDPPLSKSGINNRMRRIGQIAKEL